MALKAGTLVEFIGDSITKFWSTVDRAFSKRAGFVNRGISGQTRQQMLVRFRQDVIALKPAVVHILAGTNDIAGNTGPTELSGIESNIDPGPKIIELNKWINRYAVARPHDATRNLPLAIPGILCRLLLRNVRWHAQCSY
jgi:lysophospholipase L1-like esterase